MKKQIIISSLALLIFTGTAFGEECRIHPIRNGEKLDLTTSEFFFELLLPGTQSCGVKLTLPKPEKDFSRKEFLQGFILTFDDARILQPKFVEPNILQFDIEKKPAGWVRYIILRTGLETRFRDLISLFLLNDFSREFDVIAEITSCETEVDPSR